MRNLKKENNNLLFSYKVQIKIDSQATQYLPTLDLHLLFKLSCSTFLLYTS